MSVVNGLCFRFAISCTDMISASMQYYTGKVQLFRRCQKFRRLVSDICNYLRAISHEIETIINDRYSAAAIFHEMFKQLLHCIPGFPFSTRFKPEYFINQALHFLHIAQYNESHKTRFDIAYLFLIVRFIRMSGRQTRIYRQN